MLARIGKIPTHGAGSRPSVTVETARRLKYRHTASVGRACMQREPDMSRGDIEGLKAEEHPLPSKISRSM